MLRGLKKTTKLNPDEKNTQLGFFMPGQPASPSCVSLNTCTRRAKIIFRKGLIC